MKELKAYYNNKKQEIRNRLEEFKDIFRKGDKDIFSELCFCILTPQSDAVKCDKAINGLKKTGLLFNGVSESISPRLKSARFLNKKAEYIVEARRFFKRNGSFSIKRHINGADIFKTREWLVENIKGIGYKEASHFLRNIGFGRDLAILDIHILKNLSKYKVIKEIPKSITKARYIEVENRMRKFSRKIKIPMDELDLLFWSKETGRVFK